MHMVEHRRNQKQLRNAGAFRYADRQYREAHTLLQRALSEGATSLDTHESARCWVRLRHPYSSHWIAADSACSEAVHIADEIGYPVALKPRSPIIPHKSEVQA